MRAFIHQIFYDEATRENLDPAFIALDNTANPRPDWYEFWVIRHYLKTNTLEEDAWYGFLSPNFSQKSGFTSSYVLSELAVHADADVALFTVGWEQLAYFQNPFEQGEMWHPGLLAISQQFLDFIDLSIDLKMLVTHSLTSVFSNYVVAKPPFWRAWLPLADQFFEWVEAGAAQAQTTYGEAVQGMERIAPMKAFIQERLTSIILVRNEREIKNKWRVYAPDQSATCAILSSLFKEDAGTRNQFRACHRLKAAYCASGDVQYLKDYQQLRASMVFLR